MGAEANAFGRSCHVTNGGKLLGSVKSDTICVEVERAISSRAAGVQYSVEIRVLSPSRLAATLVVDGRTLPVQNFAVMDGKLSDGTIKRFADALAAAVVEATKA